MSKHVYTCTHTHSQREPSRKVKVKFAQSCLTLHDPMDYTVHGILQEYWSGQPISSPGELPNPGIESRSPALQVDSLTAEPQGKPKNTGVGSLSLLQRIFPTQELNWGLLHSRRILYQLNYEGSPILVKVKTKILSIADKALHYLVLVSTHIPTMPVIMVSQLFLKALDKCLRHLYLWFPLTTIFFPQGIYPVLSLPPYLSSTLRSSLIILFKIVIAHTLKILSLLFCAFSLSLGPVSNTYVPYLSY